MFKLRKIPEEDNKKTIFKLSEDFPTYDAIKSYYDKMGFPNCSFSLYQKNKGEIIFNHDVDCGECECCFKKEECEMKDQLPPVPSFNDIASFNQSEYLDKIEKSKEDKRLQKLKEDLIKLKVQFIQ